MIDITKYPDSSQFTYWFVRSGTDSFDVYMFATGEPANIVVSEFNIGTFGNDILEADFKLFQQRPEYPIGMPVSGGLFTNPDVFESLLAGVFALRHMGWCPDLADTRFEACVKWLESTDFFFAPASSMYHEAFPQGLMTHSFKVYNEAISLLQLPKFKDANLAEVATIALVHDWCKIGLYESYLKNVKDEKTKQWHQETAYRKNLRGLPLGHGVTSMFIAEKFFRLSNDEALAIRWHQGRWNCCREEMDELQLANEKCPLVHLLQFADQLAIVQY